MDRRPIAQCLQVLGPVVSYVKFEFRANSRLLEKSSQFPIKPRKQYEINKTPSYILLGCEILLRGTNYKTTNLVVKFRPFKLFRHENREGEIFRKLLSAKM